MFKEDLTSKEKFYSLLTGKKIKKKNVLKKFEMKMMKDYHDLYLKCDLLQ